MTLGAAQLTTMLQENGHIPDAVVTHVAFAPFETDGIGSEFLRATLSYSSSIHTLPTRMVVKRPLVGDRGLGELDVYERILATASDLPLVPYFGAIDEGGDAPIALFFADLSATHTQSKWPVIPTLANCARAVQTLGRYPRALVGTRG